MGEGERSFSEREEISLVLARAQKSRQQVCSSVFKEEAYCTDRTAGRTVSFRPYQLQQLMNSSFGTRFEVFYLLFNQVFHRD